MQKQDSTPLSDTLLQSCHHNLNVPISRLLPELLSEIFILCRPIVDFPNDPNLNWLYTICLVCRHWRDIAFESPGLWAEIILDPPACTSLMLARSKDAPLVIRVWLNWDSIPRIKHLLVGDIRRIFKLDLMGSRDMLQDFFGELGPFPFLQSLKVFNYESQHYNTFELLPNIISEPLRLRHLRLHGCAFTWVSPQFTGLRTLDLQNIPLPLRPTLLEFMTFMKHVPLLECLSLVLATPRTMQSGVCVQTLTLHHLAEITLGGPLIDCAGVLSHLSFPPTTSIHCAIIIQMNVAEPFSLLIPNLMAPFQRRELLRLRVEHSQETSSGLIIKLHGYCTSQPSSPSFRILAQADGQGRDNLLDFAKLMWESLPLGSVRNVTFADVELSDLLWQHFLRPLDSATAVTFEKKSGAISALLEDAKCYGIGSRQTMLLPSLKSITLLVPVCWILREKVLDLWRAYLRLRESTAPVQNMDVKFADLTETLSVSWA